MICCLFSFLGTIHVSSLKQIASKDRVYFFSMQALSKLHYLTMGTDQVCPCRLLL